MTSLFVSMSEHVMWSHLGQKEAKLILPMKDRGKRVSRMWSFSVHLGGGSVAVWHAQITGNWQGLTFK